MSLSTNYNPKDNETQIYSKWMDANIGHVPPSPLLGGVSSNTKTPIRGANNVSGVAKTHSILMPPPNLTGDLHAGHAFQHYLMDTLSRIARQKGEQNLWFPGVDHAGLQLEGVIDKLIKKGEFDEIIKKNAMENSPYLGGGKTESFDGGSIAVKTVNLLEIKRDDLPKYLKTNHPDLWLECTWSKVNLWRDNQKNQSAVLGDTPDYDRSLFTLDPQNLEMVNYAFQKYWQDGLIYKGSYLVNWSVGLQTALSDVAGEIEYEKRIDPFVTFEYRLFRRDRVPKPEENITEQYISLHDAILVSTVRPETIFGDYAVAVHPTVFTQKYEKYRDFLKAGDLFVSIPLINKMIPVILVDEVDPTFGTGALKITPANDIVDYNIFNKYIGGDFESAIGKDGKLTDICEDFAGLTIQDARKIVIHQLVKLHFVPKKTHLILDSERILDQVQNDISIEKKEAKNYFNIEFAENINPEDYQIDWNYEHNVTICERTKTVVEPLISEEFFISYHKEFNWSPIANDLNSTISNKGRILNKEKKQTTLQDIGLEAIKKTNFYSQEYKERGINFLENIKDWCISRDLIWGHKMPVWYNLDTNPERKFWSCEELNPVSRNTEEQGAPYQGAGGTAVQKLQLPINMKLIQRAKEMSKNMTTSEKLVWDKILSSKKTGFKWIKQHIVGNFILDFFCFELGLCIEIDGETHMVNKDYDKTRTDFLNLAGIKVIRYNNLEVQNNIEGVGLDISAKIEVIQQTSSTPLPPDRGSQLCNDHFAISVTKPTTPGNWAQEEKILDTWFSSCLWPLSTLKYPEFVKSQTPYQGARGCSNLILIHGGEIWKDKKTYRDKIQNGDLNWLWYKSNQGSKKTFKSDLINYCKDSNILFADPQMPNRTNADYTKWKMVFEQTLPYLNSNSILVGHSLGSMFLTKYLNENEINCKAVFLVSGGLWSDTENNIEDFDTNWGLGNNFEKLKNLGSKINIVHSKDDKVVEFQRSLDLKSKLPDANFIELDAYGHLNLECDELLELIKNQLENSPYLGGGKTKGFDGGSVAEDLTNDFATYYPTQELVTGKDIFYQWIVRMTTLSYYFTAEIPYQDLVITPTILDDKGKKMSKSLGNGMDPVAQIDKYSSDSMRMAMLGGMIPDRNIKMGGRLADELCEKYRNFGNKMWNVARFFEYQEEKETK